MSEERQHNLKQSKPAKHHFVPKLILRHFTDENGKLFFFDRRVPDIGVRPSTPTKIFRQNHLYSTIAPDGSKDPQLEGDISKIETRADEVVTKIIDNVRRGLAPSLSDQEKMLWDEFTLLQWKRTPQSLEKYMNPDAANESIDQLIAEFEQHQRRLTQNEREQLNQPGARDRLIQNIKVDVVRRRPNKSISFLNERGIGIAVISNKDKSFVIGSNPIVKLNHPGRSHISDHSTEVWFPISHDIAITPGLDRGSEIIVEMKDSNLRNLNLLIAKQSTVVAGRSKRLVESLIDPR